MPQNLMPDLAAVALYAHTTDSEHEWDWFDGDGPYMLLDDGTLVPAVEPEDWEMHWSEHEMDEHPRTGKPFIHRHPLPRLTPGRIP